MLSVRPLQTILLLVVAAALALSSASAVRLGNHPGLSHILKTPPKRGFGAIFVAHHPSNAALYISLAVLSAQTYKVRYSLLCHCARRLNAACCSAQRSAALPPHLTARTPCARISRAAALTRALQLHSPLLNLTLMTSRLDEVPGASISLAAS